jgi:hypothetical protein
MKSNLGHGIVVWLYLSPLLATFVFFGSLRIHHNSHVTIDRGILRYLERVVQRRVVPVVF